MTNGFLFSLQYMCAERVRVAEAGGVSSPTHATWSPLGDNTECCDHADAHAAHILQSLHNHLVAGTENALASDWTSAWEPNAETGMRRLHEGVHLRIPLKEEGEGEEHAAVASWLHARWWPNVLLAGGVASPIKRMVAAGLMAGFSTICVQPTHAAQGGAKGWVPFMKSLFAKWAQNEEDGSDVDFLPAVTDPLTKAQSRKMTAATLPTACKAASKATASSPVLVLIDADEVHRKLMGALQELSLCSHTIVAVCWEGRGTPQEVGKRLQALCRNPMDGFCHALGGGMDCAAAAMRSAVFPLGTALLRGGGAHEMSGDLSIRVREEHAVQNNTVHRSGYIKRMADTSAQKKKEEQEQREREGRAQVGLFSNFGSAAKFSNVETASLHWEEAECVVCTEPVKGLYAELQPCKHSFHAPCISAWLRVKLSCPTCTKGVRGVTVKRKAELALHTAIDTSRSWTGDGAFQWVEFTRGFTKWDALKWLQEEEVEPNRLAMFPPTEECVKELVRLQGGISCITRWEAQKSKLWSPWVVSVEWLELGCNAELARYRCFERGIGWGLVLATPCVEGVGMRGADGHQACSVLRLGVPRVTVEGPPARKVAGEGVGEGVGCG